MSDHTNIFANRMRSATSAAQRKIMMQQAEAMTLAVNFAVTDQKGQPLKVGDKVKTSRGVTGIITEIIGSRVYVQSEDSFDTHQTGVATWVEPADRLVKMQADVRMAMADRDQQELLRVVSQVADALVNAKIKCAAAQRSSSIRSTPADASVLEGINRLVTKALEEAEKLL
jgi:Icc-related predicted phosphoesterase